MSTHLNFKKSCDITVLKIFLKIPRGVIRSHKSKDSQYNGKQEKDKIYKTLNRKLNIEQHEPISRR